MRKTNFVINDIKEFVKKKGFIYALCMVLAEDFVVDAENIQNINIRDRVSNNEALLLLWFMIQGDLNFSTPDSPQDLIELKKEIYSLLEELHNSFSIPFIKRIEEWINNWFQKDNYQKHKKDFFWNWEMLIEPIFYAGSWVYDFQYLEYLEKKYKYDKEWLLAKKGFEIEQSIKIVNKIKDILHNNLKKVNFQWLKERLPNIIEKMQKKYPNQDLQKEANQILPMLEIHQYVALFFESINEQNWLDSDNMRDEWWKSFYKWLIDLFVIKKSDFDHTFNIIPFLENFSITLGKGDNALFQNIWNFNILKSKPIIQLDAERYFVPITFILFEAIYESPYYWMIPDKAYWDEACKNRWIVWEEITYDFLVKVFWKGNTFKSVKIKQKKSETITDVDITDIDVLCILWSKALCVQVKSQKLTEISRTWDDEQLKKDFYKAVQHAYNQWLLSRQSILDKNSKLIDEDWQEIILSEKINEVYIIWVTTENYPSLNHQANILLEKKEVDQNAIFLSIFDLELLVHYLKDPYDFLYYIRQRIDLVDYFNADEEIVFLWFHLENKLWVDEKYNMCAIDNQFWNIIDRNYYPYKVWLKISDKGDTIKNRWKNNNFEKLFDEIKEIKSEYITDIIFHLLDLSWEWRDNFIEYIIKIKNQTLIDWKGHNFIIQDVNITYVSLETNNQEELKKQVISFSEKHKYQNKSNIWIWFWSLVDSKKIIDMVYFHKEEFFYDEKLEKLFGEKWNNNQLINMKTWKKLNRSSPCPCWSWKKFKRCCWNKYYN